MEEKKFKVAGTFRMGDDSITFSKQISAKNEKHARHKVISKLGSNHKCAKTQIKIQKVEKI